MITDNVLSRQCFGDTASAHPWTLQGLAAQTAWIRARALARGSLVELKMRFLDRIDRSWRRLLWSLFSMHEWKFCAIVLESGVACHTICLIFNCCVSDCFMQVVTCGFSVASCRPLALTQFDLPLSLHMRCHILCLLRGVGPGPYIAQHSTYVYLVRAASDCAHALAESVDIYGSWCCMGLAHVCALHVYYL